MIQHPLPQNVTAYQFRLIGDMTIKQFIILSAGVAGAIFFYYTNLFSPIKWLFVVASGMAGFAIAFMPLEDRPLDQWIMNYLRAIYRPTRFIWRKDPPPPDYFSFTASRAVLPADAQEMARSAALRRQQGLRSFLITLPQDQLTVMDSQESSALTQVLDLFHPLQNPIPPLDLSHPVAASLNIAPQAAITQSTALMPETFTETASPPPKSTAPAQITGVVNTTPLRINKTESLNVQIETTGLPMDAHPTSTTLMADDVTAPVTAATTTVNLPFPSTPTTPNTIVGMVLDPIGKIVENAIIEVVDDAGLTARATKTNQLGQFFSTTPLKTGTYRINIEKAGLSFDTIELNLSGKIIEPVKIQAKA